jgi:hypothetical protein
MFRPDRDGTLSVLDFVKSVDEVVRLTLPLIMEQRVRREHQPFLTYYSSLTINRNHIVQENESSSSNNQENSKA